MTTPPMEALVASMPFATLLGLGLIKADKAEVVGEMTVRPDLCTIGGTVHGGALMALADSVGAIAAFLNLPEGSKGTTTIQSNTNLIAGAPIGARLIATSIVTSAGKRLCVLRTEVRTEEGKIISVTTQTQLVLS